MYKPLSPSRRRKRTRFLLWLGVLGLLAALIGLAVRFSGETVVIKTQVKTLQEQNKQLNKDLKDAQTKKAERERLAAINQQSSGLQPMQRDVERSPIGGNCEVYRGLVSQYSWNVETALRVMQAESGCNPNALSVTSDRGLMQINWVHSAKVGGNLDVLYDPATNIRVAYQVYQGASWSAWSVCTRGIVACYQ